MLSFPFSGLFAPNGLRRFLGSWLPTVPSAAGRSSGDIAFGTDGSNGHSSRSVRVLVVDDNPVNLLIISALLESRGLVPMLAADGAEAVALACDLHFDLILMDLQMPVLDGLEATSEIRRFERTSSRPAVPVVAYSSGCPRAGVLLAFGLNGSLVKPCADQDLEACLVRWCPNYRAASSARAVVNDEGKWQAARRNAGMGSASPR